MSDEAEQSYQFGPFRLNLSEHTLLRDGQPVPITPKVFDVLGVLVRHRGHLVAKETLLREVWPGSFVEEGALNRSVSVLRKALGDSPSGQEYIETVPKRGYRFVAPVSESPDDSPRSVVDQPSRAVTDIDANDTHSVSLSNTAHGQTTPSGMSPRVAAIAGVLLAVGALSYTILGTGERNLNGPQTTMAAHRQVTFTGKSGTPTISPDGRRIAYVSDENPEKKLIVQELAVYSSRSDVWVADNFDVTPEPNREKVVGAPRSRLDRAVARIVDGVRPPS